MSSRFVSFGYEHPSEDAISVDSVIFSIGEITITDDIESMPAWDYETPIHCKASCSLDLGSFTEQCGFDVTSRNPRPKFGLQLVWTATKTRQKGHSEVRELLDGSNSVEFTVQGDRLGGTLQVRLEVSLISPGVPVADAVSPEVKGCRIWESDKYELDLEGEGSRFTVAPIDFKKAGIEPSNAMWRFEVANDLLSPAQTGIRAYINVGNKTSLRMLEKPSSAEAKMWKAFLNTEVIIQLLSLSDDVAEQEDLMHSEYYEGSLAESVVLLADILFPGEPLIDISRDATRLNSVAQAYVFKDFT